MSTDLIYLIFLAIVLGLLGFLMNRKTPGLGSGLTSALYGGKKCLKKL